MTIKNTHNMEDGQTFIITYTKKDGEKVTRKEKILARQEYERKQQGMN